MPARSLSATGKTTGKRKDSAATKKGRKNVVEEEIPDPRQEQIDGLLREQERIRSKLNLICSRIVENVHVDDYPLGSDLSQQQPADIALEHLLAMVDELGYFRNAFLNLIQETDEQTKRPVQEKIHQLAVEEPQLFRIPLTSDQRLTFVVRERDLWKENAQILQMLYATIVDQLEMGVFQKLNPNAGQILQAHRLNLEDACRIFLSPSIRSLNDRRSKRVSNRPEEPAAPVIVEVDTQPDVPILSEPTDNTEPSNSSSAKLNRRVSFADRVDIFSAAPPVEDIEQPHTKTSLPSAAETLVENMDSNLRMLIIKELSKDGHIQRPPSKMSSLYRTTKEAYQRQTRSPKWVEFARLLGTNESEIDHWLSQSLQYPAGRVLSTWCNGTPSPPTVAELYKVISSSRVGRPDLARAIETLYSLAHP